MSIKFYDTNALLLLQEKIFDEKFAISSISLNELEHIKTSRNKDEAIKYGARRIIHMLDENTGSYDTIVYKTEYQDILAQAKLEDTPDNKILVSALVYQSINSLNDMVFITNDICCKVIAKEIFELNVESIQGNVLDDTYKGFVETVMNDEELALFYSNPTVNTYDLKINEYLIINDADGNYIDSRRWTGENFEPVFKKTIKSTFFGDKLKPKDIYQQLAIDSLMNNTMTAISGKAGSGKSLLTLMAAMHLIDNGKYNKLVVMFNATKTRNASDMGYYAGDFTEKAMQNSIGHILTSKFGDPLGVEILVQKDKLKLVSMADARGMEVKDDEILWITECQNTSVELIKLCLSRVSSGAKVFIEGDYTNQVDSYSFEGKNNGLKRAIDIFQGHEEFGYVQLQNVWRSKIAELCELL